MILRILVFVFLINPALAMDLAKFTKLYRKQFGLDFCLDLYLSQAEYNACKERRALLNQELLNYSSNDLDNSWKNYLQANFPDPRLLDQKLGNQYISIKNFKQRFVEALDLQNYFDQVIVPKINQDFELSKTLVASKKINKLELDQMRLQAIENLGGKARYANFLQDNDLTEEDFNFLVQVNCLKKQSRPVFEAFVSDDQIKTKYYFKIASISKSVPDADLRLWDAHNIFEDKKKMQIYPNLDPNIKIYDLVIPEIISSNIYQSLIKTAIQDLAKSPSYYKLSDIIEVKDHLLLIELYAIKS